jgi:hypothetical protein
MILQALNRNVIRGSSIYPSYLPFEGYISLHLPDTKRGFVTQSAAALTRWRFLYTLPADHIQLYILQIQMEMTF